MTRSHYGTGDRPPSPPDRSPEPKRRAGGIAAFLLSAFLAVGGFVGFWFTSPQFRDYVCWRVGLDEVLPCEPDVIPVVPTGPVSAKISTEEARPIIDRFLASAGGPEWWKARRELLTADEQGRWTAEEFGQEWAKVLWAERLDDTLASSGGKNYFSFQFRSYYSDVPDDNEDERAPVREFEMEVQLERDGKGILISELGEKSKTDSYKQTRAPVHSADQTETYVSPSREARVAAPEINPKGVLYVLCQLQTRDGSWWSRTPLGWIAHEDLEDSPEDLNEVDGLLPVDRSVPSCEVHHER